MEEVKEDNRTHRQHAVPQHIGAFQFKLVGPFTLKQFGFFAVFGFLAWLVFASNLFPLIKLPLTILLFSTGVLLAFFPVAGRPLDQFLIAFFKAITNPTQRIWTKKGTLPEFLKPEFARLKRETPTTKTVTSRKVLEEYLSQFQPKITPVDFAEAAFLSKLVWSIPSPQEQKFEQVAPIQPAVQQAPPAHPEEVVPEEVEEVKVEKPQVKKVKPKKLKSSKAKELKPTPKPLPIQPPTKKPATKPMEEIETLAGITVDERRPKLGKEVIVPIASPVSFVERPVITIPTPDARATIIPTIGEIRVRKLKSRPELFGDFLIKVKGEKRFELSPELKARLGLESALFPQPTTAEKPQTDEAFEKRKETKAGKMKAKETAKTKKNGLTTKLEGGIQPKVVPPPPVVTPTQPNLIAGSVKDNKGHLLEDVILIVKNENGAPVRALKTNLLGQFSISTPLPNGKYTINPEKEGYKFSIIELEAKGEIITPIEITAKN